MTRCTSCGTENLADARFCKQCGRALDQDDGPITVVPGQPAAPGTRSRLSVAIIGLMFVGLVAATSIGYFVGTHVNSAAPAASAPVAMLPEPVPAPPPAQAEPVPQSKAEPTAAEPAQETEPEQKTQRKPVPKAKPPEASAPPAAPAADQWARMRSELAACGKTNLICHEKVRWRYCKNMWGKVPECPQAGSNASTN